MIDEMRPNWPVIKEETFDFADGKPPIHRVTVEPPITQHEIDVRRCWLDGYRAGKAGRELSCCGLSESEHPTYPTACGHEFGMHYWRLRGCAACTIAANLPPPKATQEVPVAVRLNYLLALANAATLEYADRDGLVLPAMDRLGEAVKELRGGPA